MWLKRWIFAAAVLALGGGAAAQYVPLYENPATRTSLSFDLDGLLAYNLYERSRWGAGFKFTLRDSLEFTGYVGYGVRDQQWKGGGAAAYKIPFSRRGGTFTIAFARDYFAAASRQMKQTSITDISGLSHFMTQLMDDRMGVSAGYLFSTRRATYMVSTAFFEGRYLYQHMTPLYLVDGATPERRSGMEVCLTMHRKSGFSAEMLVADHRNWRLLMQYDHQFGLGPLYLSTFAQMGLAFLYADVYYKFDLGGTYGSPLWFRNSMLTVRPYEHIVPAFVFSSLRLQTKRPLFRLWSSTFAVGSNPRPMVGVSGAWGGRYRTNDSESDSEPSFVDVGAVEVMAAVDGIIRWGVADYGALFALRPWPLVDGSPRTVLLLTASLAL